MMTITIQPNRQPIVIGNGFTVRGTAAYEVFQ